MSYKTEIMEANIEASLTRAAILLKYLEAGTSKKVVATAMFTLISASKENKPDAMFLLNWACSQLLKEVEEIEEKE